MGSYPYSSSYLTGGLAPLPPYPLRRACEYIDYVYNGDEFKLISDIGNAMGVYYNNTGNIDCYIPINVTSILNENILDSYYPALACGYFHCTTVPMPQSMNGITDMFFESIWNYTDIKESCKLGYSVVPRQKWGLINYGGYRISSTGVSNIVFSNGMLDPLHGAGVLVNLSISNDLYAINTGYVGHHMDLFFSNPNDTESIINARKFEIQKIQEWLQ